VAPSSEREALADDVRAGGAADLAGVEERFCGVAAAAALLGDTWTLLLVRDLAGGPRRFGQLQASTGISPRVLTDRLHALVERGVMTRRMYPEIPPRVEYALTEKGRDILPIIDALRTYGERWLRPGQSEGRPATAARGPDHHGNV
jgi:DNA-binding HxlR family transcriptional regulator